MTDELKILIVEDNRANRMLMEMLIRQIPDCSAVVYADPTTLVDELERVDFDIALIDYMLPGMNGVDLIKILQRVPRLSEKPVVMVTAEHEAEIRLRAIKSGAVEFLHKPIEPIEFKARISNLVRLSRIQRKLANKADWLRAEIDKATKELREREEEIISRLTLAAGYKDRETAAHTKRMAIFSEMIATELGLAEELCRDIRLAATMHDIGKVGIRDDVLLKEARLDDDERAHINQHAEIGASILHGSKCELLRLASEIALSHHERWDGAGYPLGLSGTSIPLPARIAAVADVFDALTSERPYKGAWSVDRAFAFLRQETARQFDPECVAAFERCRKDVVEVMAQNPDDDQPRRAVA